MCWTKFSTKFHFFTDVCTKWTNRFEVKWQSPMKNWWKRYCINTKTEMGIKLSRTIWLRGREHAKYYTTPTVSLSSNCLVCLSHKDWRDTSETRCNLSAYESRPPRFTVCFHCWCGCMSDLSMAEWEWAFVCIHVNVVCATSKQLRSLCSWLKRGDGAVKKPMVSLYPCTVSIYTNTYAPAFVETGFVMPIHNNTHERACCYRNTCFDVDLNLFFTRLY